MTSWRTLLVFTGLALVEGACTTAPETSTVLQPTLAGRDPSQIPFASDSVFNLPLGSGAQWQYNQQLAGASVMINVNGNWNENIWTGTASDPLVTVTNNGAAGGTASVFQIHIPAGAVPAGGGDRTFSVDDTVTHTWYGMGGFAWTGADTATVSQASGEPDYGSGLEVQGSDWDEGVGTLRKSDLQAGVIAHMLRVELSTQMLLSWSQTSTNVLCPYCWPQDAEDGFALDGNGGGVYTGTVPYGATIGIPASAAEPADVQADAGAHMLWVALQTHGAMIRDSGGFGNTVTFQTDQDVYGDDPLIQGMINFGSRIMAATQILVNQGPNSVNGGGTPIVPLDPPPDDAPGGPGDGGVLTPGSGGSVTDGAGNAWTLPSSGCATENGSTAAGGCGTSQLTVSGGTVYGQDAGSGRWYVWTGSGWAASASGPM